MVYKKHITGTEKDKINSIWWKIKQRLCSTAACLKNAMNYLLVA